MTTRYLCGVALLGLMLLPMASAPANANLGGLTQSAVTMDDSMVIQVQRRAVGAGRAVVVRPARVARPVGVGRAVRVTRPAVVRPAVVARPAVIGRGLYRGRWVYRGGPWVRPRAYWWPVGGAIAAGAALGVLAASSAAWAGPSPGPGYCWYYTDPSQRQGFWDAC